MNGGLEDALQKLLLSPNDVAHALGISRRQFYNLLPTLRALGLRQKWLGQRRRYLAEDLPKVIERLEGDGTRPRGRRRADATDATSQAEQVAS